ncbi:hypothetical protein K456DRAFT_1307864 [Colletotrichum gloeosporioides 23]|nr:hypothetical protein K456DRAFT_1307864 [Colletotrichum gloeosporioides 23]
MSYNWTVPESLAESPNYTISYYNQTANPFPSAADAVSNVFAIIASREPTSSGSSLSTGAKVGIGIGVALAVAFCILGAWTLLRRRRQSLRTFESCVEETRGFEKPEPDSKGTQQSMELDAESSKAELDSSNTQRRAELEVESSGTQGTGGIGTIISRKEPAELP